MSNKVFSKEHFVEFCKGMLGMPYWYGTTVCRCTESLRARKAKQYPDHYGSSRIARYLEDINNKKVCADCVGLIKGYMWTNGGVGVLEAIGTGSTFTSKYGSNDCPDKSANGMFSYAKSKGCAWGTIDTLPEIPGIALRSDGHVGVYIGNGYAIEERGFNYGCVKTKVKNRKWTHWYQLPFIDYGDASFTGASDKSALGARLLQKGSKGADVKALQESLIQLSYDLSQYGADSDFGTETEKALIAFQKRYELEADGKYGDKSHTMLMSVLADRAATDTGENEQEDPAIVGTTVVIVSEGDKVNVRYDNGTEYESITTVAPGTTYPLVAAASNAWYAIVVGDKVGWVAGEFSRVV